MDSNFARLGERFCFVIGGVMIGQVYEKWDAPVGAIPVYAGIMALILVARWAVVTHRNNRDAARKSQVATI